MSFMPGLGELGLELSSSSASGDINTSFSSGASIAPPPPAAPFPRWAIAGALVLAGGYMLTKVKWPKRRKGRK